MAAPLYDINAATHTSSSPVVVQVPVSQGEPSNAAPPVAVTSIVTVSPLSGVKFAALICLLSSTASANSALTMLVLDPAVADKQYAIHIDGENSTSVCSV